MNKITNIFQKSRPLIGMIHFPPLIGYPDHPGLEYIANKMLAEAKILEESKFDGIIIENNYDLPHSETIPKEASEMFLELAKILERNIKIPFGLDVLWNDYQNSLSICSQTKSSFFRVPAFVDSVMTSYGLMVARSKEVIQLRKDMNLEHIAIFADIQVKHSEMIDKTKSLTQSANEAITAGADVIIITGKWTGDAPKTSDLEETRKAVGNSPIFIGSGATIDNLNILTKYADGIIVGTALKDGENVDKSIEINLKRYSATISKSKSVSFAQRFHKKL